MAEDRSRRPDPLARWSVIREHRPSAIRHPPCAIGHPTVSTARARLGQERDELADEAGDLPGLEIDPAGSAVAADEPLAREGRLDHALEEAPDPLRLARGLLEVEIHALLEGDDVAGVDDVLLARRQ